MKVGKNITYFITSDTISYAAYSVINIFLTFLITQKVSANRIDFVGYLISYYMIFTAFIGLIYARFNSIKDFNTEKKIVAWGMFIYGLFTCLLGFATTIFHIIFVLTIWALIDGITYPYKWNIFSKILDKNNEEFEWSLENFATAVAGALMAALAGYLSEKMGIEVVFTIFGILFIISGISFYKVSINTNFSEKIKSLLLKKIL